MTKMLLDASARGPVLGCPSGPAARTHAGAEGWTAFGARFRGTRLPSYERPITVGIFAPRLADEASAGSDVRPVVVPTLPKNAVDGVSVRLRGSIPV